MAQFGPIWIGGVYNGKPLLFYKLAKHINNDQQQPVPFTSKTKLGYLMTRLTIHHPFTTLLLLAVLSSAVGACPTLVAKRELSPGYGCSTQERR
jgi:hypothetical protein